MHLWLSSKATHLRCKRFEWPYIVSSIERRCNGEQGVKGSSGVNESGLERVRI